MGQPRRVLLIEGYDDLRIALRDLMSANGFDCHAFPNAASSLIFWNMAPCIAVVDEEQYNAVLRLVPESARRHVTMLVLTRQHGTTYPDADHVLMKPADPRAVIRYLHQNCRS